MYEPQEVQQDAFSNDKKLVKLQLFLRNHIKEYKDYKQKVKYEIYSEKLLETKIKEQYLAMKAFIIGLGILQQSEIKTKNMRRFIKTYDEHEEYDQIIQRLLTALQNFNRDDEQLQKAFKLLQELLRIWKMEELLKVDKKTEELFHLERFLVQLDDYIIPPFILQKQNTLNKLNMLFPPVADNNNDDNNSSSRQNDNEDDIQNVEEVRIEFQENNFKELVHKKSPFLQKSYKFSDDNWNNYLTFVIQLDSGDFVIGSQDSHIYIMRKDLLFKKKIKLSSGAITGVVCNDTLILSLSDETICVYDTTNWVKLASVDMGFRVLMFVQINNRQVLYVESKGIYGIFNVLTYESVYQSQLPNKLGIYDAIKTFDKDYIILSKISFGVLQFVKHKPEIVVLEKHQLRQKVNRILQIEDDKFALNLIEKKSIGIYDWVQKQFLKTISVGGNTIYSMVRPSRDLNYLSDFIIVKDSQSLKLLNFNTSDYIEIDDCEYSYGDKDSLIQCIGQNQEYLVVTLSHSNNDSDFWFRSAHLYDIKQDIIRSKIDERKIGKKNDDFIIKDQQGKLDNQNTKKKNNESCCAIF